MAQTEAFLAGYDSVEIDHQALTHHAGTDWASHGRAAPAAAFPQEVGVGTATLVSRQVAAATRFLAAGPQATGRAPTRAAPLRAHGPRIVARAETRSCTRSSRPLAGCRHRARTTCHLTTRSLLAGGDLEAAAAAHRGRVPTPAAAAVGRLRAVVRVSGMSCSDAMVWPTPGSIGPAPDHRLTNH